MTVETTLTPAQELAQAETAFKDLAIRVASDDTDVSPAELAEASQRVDFLRTKVQYADEAVEHQRRSVESQAIERTRKRLSALSTAKMDKAHKAVITALKSYLEAVHQYNTSATEATAEAWGKAAFEMNQAYGTMLDTETGDSYQVNIDAALRIRDAINESWNYYSEIGARVSTGPLDTRGR